MSIVMMFICVCASFIMINGDIGSIWSGFLSVFDKLDTVGSFVQWLVDFILDVGKAIYQAIQSVVAVIDKIISFFGGGS